MVNAPKTLQEFIENEFKPWVIAHHKRGNKTIASLIHCFSKLFSKPLIEITPLSLSNGAANALMMVYPMQRLIVILVH